MEADLKKKNVITLLIRLFSVKHVPVMKKKGGGRRVSVKGRNRDCSSRNFPPPTRSTFLSFFHPFSIYARHRADEDKGEEKKKKERKRDRKMEKNKERYKKMQHAWIRVARSKQRASWLYIFAASLWSGEGNARERKRNEFLSGSPSAQHKSRRLSFTRTFTLRVLRC